MACFSTTHVRMLCNNVILHINWPFIMCFLLCTYAVVVEVGVGRRDSESNVTYSYIKFWLLFYYYFLCGNNQPPPLSQYFLKKKQPIFWAPMCSSFPSCDVWLSDTLMMLFHTTKQIDQKYTTTTKEQVIKNLFSESAQLFHLLFLYCSSLF
jgi:hypothetical protein